MIETVDAIVTEIIGLERAAFDRWGKGDPSGFLEICAPDVVYFDPFLKRRIDGFAELTAHYEESEARFDRPDSHLIRISASVLMLNRSASSGRRTTSRHLSHLSQPTAPVVV